jgi:hypothetical protein
MNDQTMDISYLQYVFKVASIHVKSVAMCLPHGILPNIPRHVGINSCDNCLKFFLEVLDRPGRDCINMPLQVFPQEKKPSGIDPRTEEAMQSALNV